MDVRPTPSSAGNNSYSESNHSVSLSYINQQQDLAEVQVENLERVLEIERRKHEETKFEVQLYFVFNYFYYHTSITINVFDVIFHLCRWRNCSNCS